MQTEDGALKGRPEAALQAAETLTSKGGSIKSDQQLDVSSIILWQGSWSLLCVANFVLRQSKTWSARGLRHMKLSTAAKLLHYKHWKYNYAQEAVLYCTWLEEIYNF